MSEPKSWNDALGKADLTVDRNSWRAVAFANQATAQSYWRRMIAAEALLSMALPHVETEGDDSLAHEIKRHLSRYNGGASDRVLHDRRSHLKHERGD